MFYKKVTSRDHKWFFLLRYGDLKEGLEMWSSRSLKWQYFDYQQSRSLQAIQLIFDSFYQIFNLLNDTDLCNDIMPEEAADIIKKYLDQEQG
jgi:hypothetical protein